MLAECEETGVLTHCWGDRKSLQTLDRVLPRDPALPLLGVYSSWQTRVPTKTCTSVHYSIAKRWGYPNVHQWVNGQTRKYCSPRKRNGSPVLCCACPVSCTVPRIWFITDLSPAQSSPSLKTHRPTYPFLPRTCSFPRDPLSFPSQPHLLKRPPTLLATLILPRPLPQAEGHSFYHTASRPPPQGHPCPAMMHGYVDEVIRAYYLVIKRNKRLTTWVLLEKRAE